MRVASAQTPKLLGSELCWLLSEQATRCSKELLTAAKVRLASSFCYLHHVACTSIEIKIFHIKAQRALQVQAPDAVRLARACMGRDLDLQARRTHIASLTQRAREQQAQAAPAHIQKASWT